MLKELGGRVLLIDEVKKEWRLRIQDSWIDGVCHDFALDAANTMRGLVSENACPSRLP